MIKRLVTISVLIVFAIVTTGPLLAQEQIEDLEKRLATVSEEDKAKLLNDLAKLYAYINPHKTIEYGEKALELSQKFNNKKEECRAILHIGTGNVYMGNLKNSIELYFNKSLALAQEIGYREGEAQTYNLIAANYMYGGDPQKALEYFQKSADILEKINDTASLAKTILNMGTIYTNIGEMQKSLEYCLKAVTILEKTGDKISYGMALNNIAVIYNSWGNNDKALEYYQKAEKELAETGNLRGLAAIYSNMGEINREAKNYNRALELYLKAIKIAEELNDDATLAVPVLSVGQTYTAIGEFEKAIEYSARAQALFEEVGHNEGIARSLSNLGDAYRGLKQYQKALELLQKSNELAGSSNLKDLLQSNYKISSDIYDALNKPEEALESYRKYTAYKDEIFTEDAAKQIADMQTKYETEKKEKEIELLNKEAVIRDAEISRQRVISLSAIIGFIFIVIIALILYNRYKFKQKANLELERRNNEILRQKEEIEDKNLEITASITYAQRIQEAVFPPEELMEQYFTDSFILMKPRHIVSGDFYWLKMIGGHLIFAVADCTGHGVPGAFMSMLGITFLNEISRYNEVTKASDVLLELRNQVKKSLRQTGKDDEQKDGMDIALCAIDTKTGIMQYAGAYNPLYIIRQNGNGQELITFKADRMPIGISSREKDTFTNHEIELMEGDTMYLFSDGYIDQKGGPEGKKFMSKKFKDILLENVTKSMSEQKNILENTMNNWMNPADNGDAPYEQVDDMLIMGIRIAGFEKTKSKTKEQHHN